MRGGLTLIELLVVVVILFILGAVIAGSGLSCGNAHGRPSGKTGSGFGTSDMDRVNGR